jgi:signal transduction histidine kinase
VSTTAHENLIVRSEREIATLAISRVSIITIGIYAFYEIIAAFTSANRIAPWQFAFAAVTLILYVGGYIHIRRTDSPVSFAPLLGFMILVPLIVDRSAQFPWISNGLTCILAAVYMTGTGNREISYISATAIAVTQYVIAKAHLPSTSDLSDIQYFGSYFSSLWILVVTVAMVRMRVEYLNMCDEMDLELDELRTRMFYRRQFLKRMNLRDFLNLQLHGTVLNSLLVLRNRAEDRGIDPQELRDVVSKELSEIQNEIQIKDGDLSTIIAEQFPTARIGNVKLSVGKIESEHFSQFMRLQIIEIIREVVINAERHASATTARIQIVHLDGSEFELKVEDDSTRDSTSRNRETAAAAAMESKSIARLTKGIAATYTAELSDDGLSVIHTVRFSAGIAENDPVTELTRLRYAAVEVLAKSFLRMSIIYGLVITPGLFIKGAPTAERITFAFSVLVGAWAIFGHKFSSVARWIATLSALSILPLLEFHTTACSSIPALAWMFNGMLASVFLISSKTESPVLRWLPGIVFLAESLLTTINFPHSCNSILAGSTPGIIFILVTAFLIGRIRNRNLANDARLSRHADADETNVEATEQLVSLARQELLEDLKSFVTNYEIPPTDKVLEVQSLNLEIQKIRAFLLCSEFFEYEPARELYRWVVERASKGNEIKLNIVGEGNFDVSLNDWIQTLSILNQSDSLKIDNITVLNTSAVEIGLDCQKSDLAQFQLAVSNSPIKIRINSF